MIPNTLGALVAFLGLVAPGVLFELLRERRRPGIDESAFREASRVALTSLIFTLVGLAIVSLVGLFEPSWFPNVQRWINIGSRYAKAHYLLIARTVLVELALAAGAVALCHLLLTHLGSGQGRISSTSVWFKVLREGRRDDQVSWVHLKLNDGTEVWGYAQWYTAGTDLDDREIAVSGPGLRLKRSGQEEGEDLNEWESVIARGSEIDYMKVSYQPRA